MTKIPELAQRAIVRLRVSALEDITESELKALLAYIDDLVEKAWRYDQLS